MKRVIEVAKKDQALVYALLEAQEGLCSYSTLPFEKGALSLQIELNYAPEFEAEVDRVLKSIRDFMKGEVWI